MTEARGRIFKKPKTQRKVKITPYTGNYHLCHSRSAAISRNMELMGLSGDKYTKRFAGIQRTFVDSTTTPHTLPDPSQQCHRSPHATQPCHKSLDVNNDNKENLITTLTTTAAEVEADTTMKHEEKERKESEKSPRKRCKKSEGTSPKCRRILSYLESVYRKEIEQFKREQTVNVRKL